MLSIHQTEPHANAQLLNEIVNCDPLVGDTACQIPALKLVYTHQIIQNSTIDSTPYLTYIKDCEMLTNISDKVRGPFMSIATQRTNRDKLPPVIIDPKASNAKKDNLIANARSRVASQGIEFLSKHHAVDFFQDGLEKYLTSDYLYLNSTKIHIPVLPCFISTKMMLHIMKQERLLLIVNLHRIIENPPQLLGSDSLCYRYQDNAFRSVLPNDISTQEPAVGIEMYSSLETTSQSIVEPLFFIPECLAFIDAFKTVDIAKIILMCAAAHVQCPGNTAGHLTELSADFATDTIHSTISLSDVPIDLDHCSVAEYNALHHVAYHYGLLDRDRFFTPIRINHVSISTLDESRNKSAELRNV